MICDWLMIQATKEDKYAKVMITYECEKSCKTKSFNLITTLLSSIALNYNKHPLFKN